MTEAVLLAGGKSSRMGQDKLMLDQNGQTVLQRAVERFSKAFDRVCISVDRPERYPQIDAEHIVDCYPGSGPLAGVHAALEECKGDGVFFAASDLPFSNPETALEIMALCTAEYDICITAKPDGRTEPLFGYYRKRILPSVRDMLEQGNFRMSELFHRHPTKILTPDNAQGIWDELTFANMNTPEEYHRLLGGDIHESGADS